MYLVKYQFLKKLLAILLIVSIFYFLGAQLFKNWRELSNYDLKVNFTLLGISFILLPINFGIYALVWNKILKLFNISLSCKKCFKIIYLSQLAKYIPGKVWSYFWLVYLSEGEGIRKSHTVLSILFQTGFYAISCIFIFWLSYFLWPSMHLLLSLTSVFFILLALILLHPKIFNLLLNFFLRKIKKNTIKLNYKYNQVLLILLITILDWIIYIIALYFLIKSFYNINLIQLLIFAGISAISWLAGYLSFITPAGLGIREGTQTLLLSAFVPLPIAIIISLVERVWITLGEIGCALTSLKIGNDVQKNYNHEFVREK